MQLHSERTFISGHGVHIFRHIEVMLITGVDFNISSVNCSMNYGKHNILLFKSRYKRMKNLAHAQ